MSPELAEAVLDRHGRIERIPCCQTPVRGICADSTYGKMTEAESGKQGCRGGKVLSVLDGAKLLVRLSSWCGQSD